MSYNSKYTGAEVEALLDATNGKQDAIEDLDAIRAGAAAGATALQSVPSEYVTESELTNKGYATTSALDDKVDKVSGKQLSTEDFTSALKAKLEGLSNYNDTEISNAVSSLQTQLNTLVSGNANDAINSFNEIIAFLDGVKDTQDLSSIIASIEQQIAGKMDKVTLATVATSGNYNDLTNKPTIPTAVTENTVSGWGFTKNAGTITGIKMNGASKGTSGVVDLGTVITSHQDISGKADKSSLATVATSGSYNDLSNKPTIPAEQVNADWNATSGKAQILNKPTIPSAVTESTVSGWGFTKNTGTYSKPSGGIPKSDLDSATQQVLTTAIGDHQTIEDMSVDISDLMDEMSNTVLTQQYGEDKVAKDIDGFITRRQTIYALPDSVSENSTEDDVIATANTLKTINGQSLIGEGDINISGGGSSSGRKEVVFWDFVSDETVTSMRPNVVYWFIGIDNVIIDSFEDAASEIESYDVFTAILELGTTTDASISLTLPDYVRWANGAIPEIEADVPQYELSISRISDGWGSPTYRAVLTPFKIVE